MAFTTYDVQNVIPICFPTLLLQIFLPFLIFSQFLFALHVLLIFLTVILFCSSSYLLVIHGSLNLVMVNLNGTCSPMICWSLYVISSHISTVMIIHKCCDKVDFLMYFVKVCTITQVHYSGFHLLVVTCESMNMTSWSLMPAGALNNSQGWGGWRRISPEYCIHVWGNQQLVSLLGH